MTQTTTTENKTRELGTLAVQNLIYQRYLETYKLRQGKTFDELLRMANDPRRYSKIVVKNKERSEIRPNP